MEIEEGFRDLKSSQFGFSFEDAHSVQIRRIQVLLMIAMLATLFFILLDGLVKKCNCTFNFKLIQIKKDVCFPFSISVVAESLKKKDT